MPPLEVEYHAGVHSLALWAGPDWCSNERTNFFVIRHLLIKEVERWRAHTWSVDRDRISRLRFEIVQRPQLNRATSEFLKVLSQSEWNAEKRQFLHSLLEELELQADPKLTIEDAYKTLEQALCTLESITSRKLSKEIAFGPVLYENMPRALPRQGVAVALKLAHLITLWRRDCNQKGSLNFPQPPLLSPNTPWKAIAELASCSGSSSLESLDPSSIQMLVENLQRQVRYVH